MCPQTPQIRLPIGFFGFFGFLCFFGLFVFFDPTREKPKKTNKPNKNKKTKKAKKNKKNNWQSDLGGLGAHSSLRIVFLCFFGFSRAGSMCWFGTIGLIGFSRTAVTFALLVIKAICLTSQSYMLNLKAICSTLRLYAQIQLRAICSTLRLHASPPELYAQHEGYMPHPGAGIAKFCRAESWTSLPLGPGGGKP